MARQAFWITDMTRLAFFDLDGALRSTGGELYPRANDVDIYPGMSKRLIAVRSLGYKLIGVTNQGGVSKGVISGGEIRAAIARTQELLGDAALDLILYCPHCRDRDGRDCDCKKPAPGMVLDALTAFDATLDSAFVVGDNRSADGGLAKTLAIPFIPVTEWMLVEPKRISEFVSKLHQPEAVTPNENRITGTLIGLAVGDALGAPLEFRSRADVFRSYPTGLRDMIASRCWRKGQYTDDTEMALVIADSLLEQGRYIPCDIARRFVSWARTANDVGIQTRAVLARDGYAEAPEVHSRSYYEQHAGSSAGNGAVMRCAPIALFHLSNLPMLLADSRRSARLTHADPKAQSSCVLLNVCIRQAILQRKRDARILAVQYLTPSEQKHWVRLLNIESMREDQIKSSGYTVDTLEAAMWSFLTTNTFEEAVVRAANLGDDADTVAAVTGVLAGAYYGCEEIPSRWRASLENESLLRETVHRLAGICAARSSQNIMS